MKDVQFIPAPGDVVWLAWFLRCSTGNREEGRGGPGGEGASSPPGCRHDAGEMPDRMSASTSISSHLAYAFSLPGNKRSASKGSPLTRTR
jgi:hypothetical protein